MNLKITTVAALVSTTVTNAMMRQPAASCCIVYSDTDYRWRSREYCLDNTKRESAYALQ